MDNKKDHPPVKYVAILSNIIDKVQKNLKNHDQLLPVAFLFNEKKMEVLASPMGDSEEKDLSLIHI